MLLTYNHLSELDAAALQRLKAFVRTWTPSARHVVFEGKTFSANEVMAQRQIWESESTSTRRMLLE